MTKRIAAAIAALALLLGTAGCTTDWQKRRDEQNKYTPQGETLEQKNLKERLRRDEQADRIGYVYLVNFGKPFGYYVIKGKISSSGSQLGPEEEIISGEVVDSNQDDGTYGTGDPGIFFFLATGTKVETTLDYIYSDEPIAIDVPLLGK